LHPLTLKTPKPLLQVGQKPMIDHIIDKIQAVPQIDGIFVVTNDTFHNNFIEWQSARQFKVPCIILNDGSTSNENRRGAVGDIHFAVSQGEIIDDVLILGGDNLFDFDINDMMRTFAQKQASTVALYDCKSLEIASKCGIAETDGCGRIVGFAEKPAQPRTTLIATLIYAIRKEDMTVLNQLIESGAKLDNAGEFIKQLSQHTEVQTHKYEGYWFDIGTMEQYSKIRNAFP
jgi:glucose-1-phosphate thymidylyltransferase